MVANALMAWLDRRHHGPGVATVVAFVARAGDPVLSRAVAEVDEQLYGEGSAAHGAKWSANERVRAVSRERGRQRRSRGSSSTVWRLAPLNPTGRDSTLQ